jgi:hypothetical protein
MKCRRKEINSDWMKFIEGGLDESETVGFFLILDFFKVISCLKGDECLIFLCCEQS